MPHDDFRLNHTTHSCRKIKIPSEVSLESAKRELARARIHGKADREFVRQQSRAPGQNHHRWLEAVAAAGGGVGNRGRLWRCAARDGRWRSAVEFNDKLDGVDLITTFVSYTTAQLAIDSNEQRFANANRTWSM